MKRSRVLDWGTILVMTLAPLLAALPAQVQGWQEKSEDKPKSKPSGKGKKSGTKGSAESAQLPKLNLAAKVDDTPIYREDVELLLRMVFAETDQSQDQRDAKFAAALAQWVDRTLVLQQLTALKLVPDKKLQGELLEEYCQQNGLPDETPREYLKRIEVDFRVLRRQLTWDVSWRKYLDGKLTDEEVSKFFDKHRKEFDGTQQGLSQILLQFPPGDVSEREVALQKARSLRQEIMDGKRTFAAAAKEFSAGPSGKNGGDLGLIPRHGVMPEPFAKAAFLLEVGEISEPIETNFGVHLITCTQTKPGDKSLDDVRAQVEDALAKEWFSQLAEQSRQSAKIEYSAGTPHLDPKSGGLVR